MLILKNLSDSYKLPIILSNLIRLVKEKLFIVYPAQTQVIAKSKLFLIRTIQILPFHVKLIFSCKLMNTSGGSLMASVPTLVMPFKNLRDLLASLPISGICSDGNNQPYARLNQVVVDKSAELTLMWQRVNFRIACRLQAAYLV